MKAETRKAVIEMTVVFVLSLAGGTAACGLYLWSFSIGGDVPHKSDEELIANFQSHREEFNRLLQMVMEDKALSRVDINWTSPANPQAVGISRERVDEYRALFKKLGVPRGFNAFQARGVFEFIASAQGLSTGGSSKGYIYFKWRPVHVVESLDEYRQLTDKPYSYPVYRHIEGNWYLFYDAN